MVAQRRKKVTNTFTAGKFPSSIDTLCASLEPCDSQAAAAKMISARRLQDVMKSALVDGIDGVCIMTNEGGILSSGFVDGASLDETTLAAVASSMWSAYLQGTPALGSTASAACGGPNQSWTTRCCVCLTHRSLRYFRAAG